MKSINKVLPGLLATIALLNFGIPAASAAPYRSLEGVTGLDVAFDFRLTDPKTAALFLQLIHETWLDQDVKAMDEPAIFVVVVNGGAVKLVAEDQPGYSAEEQEYIHEIAMRIARMANDGIRFEGCLKAAQIFGVDHNLFLGDIEKINNAWISIAGYQAQRYSALPIN
jgi:intracellular sulfur oxidation DsrE/DsrF family protein